MDMKTSLTNQQIMTLFQNDLIGELTDQPLYYSASKKCREIRRMIREQMEDINDTRETLQQAHAEGHMADTMQGEQFVPETETVVMADGQERDKLVFKSEEDREKFNDKWEDLLEQEVEGFPVISERSLAKVADDIRISGSVLDVMFEFGLIQDPDEYEADQEDEDEDDADGEEE